VVADLLKNFDGQANLMVHFLVGGSAAADACSVSTGFDTAGLALGKKLMHLLRPSSFSTLVSIDMGSAVSGDAVDPFGLVTWKEILDGKVAFDAMASDIRGEVGVLAMVLALYRASSLVQLPAL